MKPYVAVILDSFHAAMSSRILWIALIAIWLCLAAICPLGVRDEYKTSFINRDFYDGTRMKALLAQGLKDPTMADKPLGRMAAALPDRLTGQLESVADGEDLKIEMRLFTDALNEMLDDESWYDAEVWSDTVRQRELRELDETPSDELDDTLRRRRARLRIEVAMPGVFRSLSSRTIMLTYAGLDFPTEVQVDKTQFAILINQFVMPFLISSLLGAVLVFLGILVTASIVPDMLQPGSLHLLLSKPISRSLLLISKFVGGCAFVVLCVSQLVVGLWLIAGFRLDVWNVRILWCIPTSVFLFAVYYSVSVFAGLRWRSSILSIGVTCLFAALCFVVGFVGGLFDGLVTGREKIRSIAVQGDLYVGATNGGKVVGFDAESNRWIEVIDGNGFDRIIGPVEVGDSTFAVAKVLRGRRNTFGSGAVDIEIVRPAIPGGKVTDDQSPKLTSQESSSVEINQQDSWSLSTSVRLPTATSRLYRLTDDEVMAVNGSGLFIAQTATISAAVGEVSVDEQTKASKSGWLASLMNLQGGATDEFTSILPPGVTLVPPVRIALQQSGDRLVLGTYGNVFSLRRDDNPAITRWAIDSQKTLEGESAKSMVLGVSGKYVLVAREDDPLQLLSLETLEPAGTLDVGVEVVSIESLGVRTEELFVVQLADGNLMTVGVASSADSDDFAADSSAKQQVVSAMLPYSEVESIAVPCDSGELCIVHHVDRVDILDANTFDLKREIRPSLSTWRMVDRYVVTPLRTIVPKTGELSGAVSALVGGKTSFVATEEEGGGGDVVRNKLAEPIISCSVFIIVMLCVSCVYLSRRDF